MGLGIPIIGAALDAATGVANAKMARNAFKHRYQDTVADMKAAGLNPALAYGQGGGNPQTSDLPDVGSTLTEGVSRTNSAKAAAAQADLTGAQAGLLKAQTLDLVDQVKLRNYLLNADVNLRGEQLSNLNVDTSAKTIARNRAMATYDSDIAGQKARNRIEGLAVPQAAAIAKWFKAHPDLGGWLNSAGGISTLLRTLPLLAGAAE